MAPVLAIDADVIRIFIHVIAATVWVGGQLTLAGLVPALRPFGPEVTRAAARRFNQVAWPAFGVLFVTGIWNIFTVDMANRTTSYHMTLGLKLLVVMLSGVGAAVHVFGTSKAALAVGGALAGLGAVAALLIGVTLAH
jgi:putative copper export protein